MAFYHEEDEEELGTQTPSGESATLGSGTAAPSGGGGDKPENFVGISQYINANKPQSEKLAGQVAGKIDEKAQAADTALSGAQNSFNQAAESQKVAQDDALLGEVKTNAQGVAGDSTKTGSFAKMRDATYAGPQRLEETDSWSGLQSAIKGAKDAKSLAGTEQGRMGLIKEVSNNPRQSQGALTFDNLLLQSNPGAAGKLQAAGSSLNDIDARLGAAQTGAQSKAKEVSEGNAAVSKAAKDAVSGGWQGLSQSLTDREAAADAKALQDFEAMKQSGQYTPEQLQVIGMNPDSRTYGTNLSDFMQYQDNIDKYGVAGDEDYARQAALRSLAGDMDLGGDILSNVGKSAGVGPNFSFDTNAFNQAAEGQKQAFNSQYVMDQKKLESALNDWGTANVKGSSSKPASVLTDSIKKTGDLPPDAAAAYRSIMTPAEYKQFVADVAAWKPAKRQVSQAGTAINDSLPPRLRNAQQKDIDAGNSYLKNAALYGKNVSDKTRTAQADWFGLNDTISKRLKG